MSVTPKKKDDELLITSIVMFIFLGTLIAVSFFYSSWNAMGLAFKRIIQVFYLINIVMSVIAFVKWQDPNYDKYRKYVCYLSVALIIAIGIPHATVREDEQVIIDSKENARLDEFGHKTDDDSILAKHKIDTIK